LVFDRLWVFGGSVFSSDDLPHHRCSEVAFVGRSNVGKSSLINAILNRKRLARVSRSPGCTQCLNFYFPSTTHTAERCSQMTITSKISSKPLVFAIVDMPGYGFARAPCSVVASWKKLVTDYLCSREALTRVYLLIDSLCGLRPSDLWMLDLLQTYSVPHQVLLTKLDKIVRNPNSPKVSQLILSVKETLSYHCADCLSISLVSAVKKWGIDCLRKEIASLFVGQRRF